MLFKRPWSKASYKFGKFYEENFSIEKIIKQNLLNEQVHKFILNERQLHELENKAFITKLSVL